MKKSHIAVIAALLLLTLGTAFAQNENTAVTRLAWVDADGNPLAEAHLYDTLYVSAEINSAHIPDGTEVSVVIFEYNEDGGLPDDYVTQFPAIVEDGAIRAVWKVTFNEEQTNTQCVRELGEKGWTIPRYRFRVRYTYASRRLEFSDENIAVGTDEGATYRSAFSAPMTVWGSITLQLRAGDPFNHFILRLADGTQREVVADDEGSVRAFRLPLGLAELMVDITSFIDDEADWE